jgi:hypothetical protein
MKRPKKVKEETSDVAIEKPKKLSIKLHAKYKVIDRDGTKTFPEFVSEGASVEEVLENLEFPKGVNALVVVTVTKGEKSFMKALGPARARLILENEQKIKAAESLRAAFRGII